MVQVTEYSLVIFAAALFAGASIATYGAFAKFETATESRATYSTMLSLVSVAVENGSARAELYFSQSTVSCINGSFEYVSGNSTFEQALTVPCSFSYSISPGTHEISFDYGSSGLVLEVN